MNRVDEVDKSEANVGKHGPRNGRDSDAREYLKRSVIRLGLGLLLGLARVWQFPTRTGRNVCWWEHVRPLIALITSTIAVVNW
jgi:hypothetical protein